MPGGRPSSYRPEMCNTVIELMAVGAAKVEVAAKLGICRDTLHEWETSGDKPEFADAIKRGEELSHCWWLEQGRTSMRDKEFNSTLWYMNMKNRHGWADKTENRTDIGGDGLKSLLSAIDGGTASIKGQKSADKEE